MVSLATFCGREEQGSRSLDSSPTPSERTSDCSTVAESQLRSNGHDKIVDKGTSLSADSDRPAAINNNLAVLLESAGIASSCNSPHKASQLRQQASGPMAMMAPSGRGAMLVDRESGILQWLQPSGARKAGEGCEPEEQGIISFQMHPEGDATMCVTLLASGFFIGHQGASVRETARRTGADVKSWTTEVQTTSGRERPARTFLIQARQPFGEKGPKAAVLEAAEVLAAAVVRYKYLCEGACFGKQVSREQVVCGVTFVYNAPPKRKVPLAAALASTPPVAARSLPTSAQLWHHQQTGARVQYGRQSSLNIPDFQGPEYHTTSMRGMSAPSANKYDSFNMPAHTQQMQYINANDGMQGSSMPLRIPNSSAQHNNFHSNSTQFGPSSSDVRVDGGLMTEHVAAKLMRMQDAVSSGPLSSSLPRQETDKSQQETICQNLADLWTQRLPTTSSANSNDKEGTSTAMLAQTMKSTAATSMPWSPYAGMQKGCYADHPFARHYESVSLDSRSSNESSASFMLPSSHASGVSGSPFVLQGGDPDTVAMATTNMWKAQYDVAATGSIWSPSATAAFVHGLSGWHMNQAPQYD